MGNEFVVSSIVDSETQMIYRVRTRFGGRDVEIEILRGGSLQANVLVEAYDGRCQVVVTDKENLDEDGGDTPTFLVLTREDSTYN